MVFDIKEIKEVRKKLGITQALLAKRSGVSQSLVAKIEAGKLDPTYSNALKIFNALHTLGKQEEKQAEQVMSTSIISITPKATIKEAISKMKKHGFSQLPVISQNQAVGMISESAILEAMIEGKGNTVEEIMQSPPPVISFDTPLRMLSDLLRYVPLLLVAKKGKLLGLITKTDFLASVYSR